MLERRLKMKYGDFFNGKKIILFNIDNTIRQSKTRRRFCIDPEDIELKPHARRRMVKLKHIGYTTVGISIQPDIDANYRYNQEIMADGFFLTQRKLGPGKFDLMHTCDRCKDTVISAKIMEAIKQYNPEDILYITEDGRDWNIANSLGIESMWSTRFFSTLDDIRII
jgi:histidinol phosphatase-like enzyme